MAPLGTGPQVLLWLYSQLGLYSGLQTHHLCLSFPFFCFLLFYAYVLEFTERNSNFKVMIDEITFLSPHWSYKSMPKRPVSCKSHSNLLPKPHESKWHCSINVDVGPFLTRNVVTAIISLGNYHSNVYIHHIKDYTDRMYNKCIISPNLKQHT